jgi:hypothetical protein
MKDEQLLNQLLETPDFLWISGSHLYGMATLSTKNKIKVCKLKRGFNKISYNFNNID